MCEIEPCEHEFVPRDFPKSPLSPIVSYQCSKCGMRATKATHTPSITVGTQVRLTGVVTGADGSGNLTVVLGEDFEVWIHPNKIPLEVIRQPFKRGEVVWFADGEIPCVVVEDESDNRVLLTECGVDKPNVYVETRHYERRP